MKSYLILLLCGVIIGVVLAEDSPLSESEEEHTEEEDNDDDSLFTNQMTSSAFDTMWKYYPKISRSRLFNKIGGEFKSLINNSEWRNTCTIRLSYALNRARRYYLKIPKTGGWSWKPGRWRKRPFNTKSGDDGYHYAFRVREIAPFILNRMNWPRISWINPRTPYRGGTSIPSEFRGKKGVIMFDVKIWNDATGHVDLFDGSKCANHCYFSESKNVYLWTPR